MKFSTKIFALAVLLSFCYAPQGQAQFLKKLKKKAEDKILGKDKKQETSTTTSNPNNQNSNNSNNTQGKKLTPPDVNTHLNNATSAMNSSSASKYSGTRFEIKQAIMGLELEIGEDVLAAMPTSLRGMNAEEDKDQLVSTGIGFVGLTIGRFYTDGNKSIQANVANNSGMMASYNALLTSSAGYNTGQGDHKVITVQGNRAVLQFIGDNKYTVGVPFGQSSVFYAELINHSDEADVMSSIGNFDIEKYKKLLDEK